MIDDGLEFNKPSDFFLGRLCDKLIVAVVDVKHKTKTSRVLDSGTREIEIDLESIRVLFCLSCDDANVIKDKDKGRETTNRDWTLANETTIDSRDAFSLFKTFEGLFKKHDGLFFELMFELIHTRAETTDETVGTKEGLSVFKRRIMSDSGDDNLFKCIAVSCHMREGEFKEL